MTPLPISNPAPASRETIYSYLSRLAATWQTEVTELAYDMGAPFKRFLDQDPEAFDTLADWAGLNQQQLDEMLSWTGVRAGNVRMQFRRELFVSRALRNPVVRGCPACLREDATQQGGQGVANMVMRGDWQLRDVTNCIRHRQPLTPLWKSNKPRDRHDIQARLREIEHDIMSGRLDQPETSLSDYDLWLDDRLQNDRDATWFTEQPLSASITVCRLLGEAFLRKDQLKDAPTGGTAHAAGFDIARHGKKTIRQALDQIAASYTGHLDEPNKAFGAMFRDFNGNNAVEDGFGPFLNILRECILEHWPIAPGETLLGEVVTERRVHSLVTAAQEIGIGVQVIEHFLLEAGALHERDDRPSSRRVFDAKAHAELLSEIPTLVGPKAMREAMGATLRELMALEAEGLLIPRTRIAKVKNPWRVSDGTVFMAELLSCAVPIEEFDNSWETLLLARKRTGVGLSNLVQAVREEQISVGQRKGSKGFHGIVVQNSQVDLLAPSRSKPKKSNEMLLPGEISAAEFGRTVGLRDHGNFIALVKAGQTPALQHVHPRTKRIRYRLSAEDISSFHRRFVTLTTLIEETGHHRNTLKTLLAVAGVNRFSPEGQDFGPVFLREEAVKALK